MVKMHILFSLFREMSLSLLAWFCRRRKTVPNFSLSSQEL